MDRRRWTRSKRRSPILNQGPLDLHLRPAISSPLPLTLWLTTRSILNYQKLGEHSGVRARRLCLARCSVVNQSLCLTWRFPKCLVFEFCWSCTYLRLVLYFRWLYL
ncbi:hypothetical protein LOK49_LG02G03420 [Camellia lanceoleosa]|uniref:Uncharacterized protein n=1 Tax=Camellia lanceoleosa TaxID=1840588 RepID=A0ACC0ITI4_9ERIC|nr:hypothetical protein LOK49_LG02G03420 [Camellia lanceoleosa]